MNEVGGGFRCTAKWLAVKAACHQVHLVFLTLHRGDISFIFLQRTFFACRCRGTNQRTFSKFREMAALGSVRNRQSAQFLPARCVAHAAPCCG